MGRAAMLSSDLGLAAVAGGTSGPLFRVSY